MNSNLLEQIPTCYASCSIGTSSTSLPSKLAAISAAQFSAIELSMPDLLTFANHHLQREIKDTDYDDLCAAGHEVHKLCEKYGLKILVLQPFSNFEGWPEGSPEREDAFSRERGWIEIMKAVETDMLQVGSSDSPGISSSIDFLANDLAQLADLLTKHGLRLAYENWCWATHAPTWKSAWEIVKMTSRDNVGLCLDTFQTAGSEWADPSTESGLREGVERAELESRSRKSLDELSATVPPEKIYFLQISDAYKMAPPLDSGVDEQGLRPKGRWSHDYRPLTFDGGYFPVVEVTRAVLKTGFRGWFSVEIFDGKLIQRHGDDTETFAEKAMSMHRTLLEECKRAK